jgi:hypothetical protein
VAEGYAQISRFASMNIPYRILKRMALAVGLLLTACFAAPAQQAWFVFLASDNQQPFYVQMGEKIYSSTGTGHLLLHSLKDSTYRLVIGFPQHQYPEQEFVVDINKKDHGYQLKKEAARQWQLYNWQTQQVVAPVAGSKKENALLYGERKMNDPFANLMAAVVNDSAILYTSVVKKEPPANSDKQVKPVDTTTSAVAINTAEKEPAFAPSDSVKMVKSGTETKTALPDSAVTAVTTFVTDTAKAKVEEPAKLVQQPATTTIVKLGEQQENDSLQLTYLDTHAAGIDTIIVKIPLAKEPVVQEQKEQVAGIPVKKDSTVVPVDTMAVKKDTALAVMSKPVKTADTVAATEVEAVPEKKTLNMVNSDCRSFASDYDVDKLRVRMLLEGTAGDRMAAAQKLYKTACLSAKQIKALSELFLTDESRYRFLEVSYPHVSDTDNFKKLDELLTDETFKAKFRALVRL